MDGSACTSGTQRTKILYRQRKENPSNGLILCTNMHVHTENKKYCPLFKI